MGIVTARWEISHPAVTDGLLLAGLCAPEVKDMEGIDHDLFEWLERNMFFGSMFIDHTSRNSVRPDIWTQACCITTDERWLHLQVGPTLCQGYSIGIE